ncbi:MAG: hypothetical protein R2838_18180 [Caldilineaceae bacterium]
MEELVEAQQSVNEIYVDDLVKNYIVDVVTTTRSSRNLSRRQPTRQPCALQDRGLGCAGGARLRAARRHQAAGHAALAHRLIVSLSAHQEHHAAADRGGCAPPYPVPARARLR